MLNHIRTTFLAYVVLVIAALGVSTPTPADQVTWRFNNTHVEKRTESAARTEFAQRVTELTGGRLKVDIYHGESLGVHKADLLRMLKFGVIEMSVLSPGYFGRDSRVIASLLPFGVVSTGAELNAVLPVLQDVYSEIYNDWDIEIVGWQLAIPWNTAIFCNEPIDSIAKLKGKKLRVWQKGLVKTFHRLGVAAQIIPSNEMYLAMQTGVVDCVMYGISQAQTVSLQEISDYAVNVAILSGLTAVGVNKEAWEQLPPDLKALVKQAGAELLQRSIAEGKTMIETYEKSKIREFTEQDQLQYLGRLSLEDTARFRDAANQTWLEETTAAGGEASAYRLRILEALNQHRKSESTQTAD